MNIVLLGFKAAGKSSAGRALARLTGRAFLDSDDILEALYSERHGKGLSCREIYRTHGESFMRDLETKVLQNLCAGPEVMTDTVLATGGGAVLRPENIPLLRALGLCIFLDTPPETLKKRLAAQADSPLFSASGIDESIRQRRPLYLAAAHEHFAVPPGADAESVALALASLSLSLS